MTGPFDKPGYLSALESAHKIAKARRLVVTGAVCHQLGSGAWDFDFMYRPKATVEQEARLL